MKKFVLVDGALEYFMNPPDSPYTKYRGIGFTPDEFIKMTKQYPKCFTCYCECVITQNGLVFLASPSHYIEMERLKKHGYQGLVMVWYEGICRDDMSTKMSKSQIDAVKKLVEAGLVSGASYE
jgi:hypothetical protein